MNITQKEAFDLLVRTVLDRQTQINTSDNLQQATEIGRQGEVAIVAASLLLVYVIKAHEQTGSKESAS